MSRERELLEQALEYLPTLSVTYKEISDFLASEKQDQPEPVAWMFLSGNKRRHYHTGKLQAERSARLYGDTAPVPLYLHPAPQRSFVRLSEKEISEMAQKCFIRREAGQYHIPYGTTDFTRAIEDALEEKNK